MNLRVKSELQVYIERSTSKRASAEGDDFFVQELKGKLIVIRHNIYCAMYLRS